MNVYIAYKFTNIKDKSAVRDKVHKIADIIEERYHNTFILGRDLQNWQDYTHPIHHKSKTIFQQIKKSDCILAFVDSDSFSKGLMVELIIGKFLGKRIELAVKKGIKAKTCRRMATDVVEFENLDQLKERLKCIHD